MKIIRESNKEYILDISKIKPKNIKKSDKYSNQIYQFIKQNPCKCKVYYIQTQMNYKDGESKEEEVPFDINNISCNNIWFGNIRRETYESDGYIDWMYGNTLANVVSPRKGRCTIFANPWNNKKTVVDVTENFWEKYIEIGRCIYGNHPLGLLDDEDRYTYLDTTHRKCNWCEKEEHLENKTYTYSRDEWVKC